MGAGRAWRVVRGLAVAAVVVVGGAVGGYLGVTGTAGGRRWLADIVARQADSAFAGRARLTIGTLEAIGPRRVVARDVALLDSAGVAVVAVRRLEGTLTTRALLRRAVHLSSLELEGVTLDLRRDFAGPFNLAYMLAGDTTAARDTAPGFGDDLRIDRLAVSDAEIRTQAPWAPPAVFTGAARDSVIAVRDSLHDLVTLPEGFLERRRIVVARLVAHEAIITRPDGAPSSLAIDSVRGAISDPPVTITGGAGRVAWTPDSLQLDFPALALPHSTGSARGVVSWAEPGPVRFDVAVEVEAGLADLTWIWPALPEAGRGTARVRMRTLEDPNDLEFAITALDVAAMDSRVRGDVTVVVRVADLLLRAVDLTFEPLSAALASRLSEGGVPPEVRGRFTGRFVAARGGPLTDLAIDRLDARFLDAAVPGATSSLRLSGRIGVGVAPMARDLRVEAADLDLRSLGPLAPSLPALDGRLALRGLVRSAGLDHADVRGADATWVDGVGNVSVIRGDVRARFAGRSRSVDAEITLAPLSLAALARVDSARPLRSSLAGRATIRGPFEALAWSATLASDGGGTLTAVGTAALGEGAWRVAAQAVLDRLDARAWLGRADVPSTAVDGTVTLSASGGQAPDRALRLDEAGGHAALVQPEGPGMPAVALEAAVALDSRRLRVDSAALRFGGARLDARGALARDSLGEDTLAVAARADSLGAMRPALARLGAWIRPLDSVLARTVGEVAADTLDGDLSVSGYLIGWLQRFQATLAAGARALRVGGLGIGRAFGSAQVTHLPARPVANAALLLDAVDGIGAIRVATAEVGLDGASVDSGAVRLGWLARDGSRLTVRGAYRAQDESLRVALDTLRFTYDDVVWANPFRPAVVRTADRLVLDSLALRSNRGGLLGLSIALPDSGEIRGAVRLDRFPAPEVAAFALGTRRTTGLLTGWATLGGTGHAPTLTARAALDSLGAAGVTLPRLALEADYAGRRLVARATVRDSTGGELRGEARVPVDLGLGATERRLLDESLDAEVVADRLQVGALGLVLPDVTRVRGMLSGRVAIRGTPEAPIADGRLVLEDAGARVEALGVEATEGRVVLRAVPDTLVLDGARVRLGGARDTIGVRGWVTYGVGSPRRVALELAADGAQVARQADGTEVDLAGRVRVAGTLERPTVSGRLFIPRATLVADPLGASTALDLSSRAARELLGVEEVPVAESAVQALARIGAFVAVRDARVDFGDEVWVRTPEANVRLTGGLAVTVDGERLVLDGTVEANRGVYRLDLGVVKRNFTVDSGRVRFFGAEGIAPTLDITATNVVRLATGEQIPVRVHIGGTLEAPVLTLSSTDPLYASAPESEVISLLVFGAPTFALDGQSQSTVRAVTGVLLPSVGGAVEGTLQRLLPVFNTVQVTTAGGQSQEELSALSLLDNLAITAGKQVGERTYLRLNTGVCRAVGAAAARGVSLWYGVAAEYRLAPALVAQVGVDPGAAPCTRLGGDVLPRMQFGFDLFRDWIF
jgi:translocation and assembly module TamB